MDREARLGVAISDLERSISEQEVGRIVAYISKQLELPSFEDFLASNEAQHVLDSALSERDRAWVIRTLSEHIERAEATGKKVAMKPVDRNLEPVGRTPHEVEEFCAEHGLQSFLYERRSRSLFPYLAERNFRGMDELSPLASLGELLHGKGLPARMNKRSAAAREIFDAVREAIRDELERRRLEEAIQEVSEQRPEDASLKRFSARIKELRHLFLTGRNGDAPLLEVLRTLELQDEGPSLVATFEAPRIRGARPPIETRLILAGFEDGYLRTHCDCDGPSEGVETEDEGCAHRVRLLGEALLIVHDPKHALHESLGETLSVPTWKRFLEAAEEAFALRARPDGERRERIVFRLDRKTNEPRIQIALQKRLRSGAFSSGALLAPEKALERDDLLDDSDLPIVDALLGAQVQRRVRSDGRAATTREAAALRALVGHRRVVDADDAETFIRVESHPLTVALVPVGDLVRLEFRLGDHPLDPAELELGQPILRHDSDPPRSLVGELDPALAHLVQAARDYPAYLPREAQDALLEKLVLLQPGTRLEIPRSRRGKEAQGELNLFVRLDPLESGGLRIEVCVRPFEGGASYPAGFGPGTVYGLSDGERAFTERDLREEGAARERLLAELKLHEADSDGPAAFRVPDLEEALALLERIGELGVTAEWPESGASLRLHRNLTRDDLRVRINSIGRLLGVDGDASVDEGGPTIPLSALIDAVKRGRRYVRLSDGGFARITEELRKLVDKTRDLVYEGEEGLVAGIASAAALSSLSDEVGELHGDRGFLRLLERLRDAREREPALPDGLSASLRPYQIEGFRWMSNLALWAGGGILADEMGLGKTVQTLALLLEHRDEGPSLVVAPTSVLANWASEAERFTEGLEIIVLHGRDRRKHLEDAGPRTLFITSYDLLVRDIEILETIEFAGLILDEAQSVKNPRTQRAKAAGRIHASFRFALTGTPLENHLGELYSIFDLVTPGLLGSTRHFRDHYALPIEKVGNEERRAALSDVIRPFLLRRTKTLVAPELPEKIEVIHPIELSDSERLLYETARREILEGFAESDENETERRFQILAALTRLRRLVCNPRLVDPNSRVASSKLAAFIELSQELLADGHRALVFSQFTGHLKLVRERLDALGIPTLYLDGSTPQKQREGLVEAFQNHEAPLFLISLKAGGTGLNLTAADYVIHLDPWWNPAAEDQASDRAHRLGRVDPVTVIRIVAEDTIEEAVLALHERKRELAQGILEGTDIVGTISSEELLDLLRHGTSEARRERA